MQEVKLAETRLKEARHEVAVFEASVTKPPTYLTLMEKQRMDELRKAANVGSVHRFSEAKEGQLTVRKQIQECLVDAIGRKKEFERIHKKAVLGDDAKGHLMLTIIGCKGIQLAGKRPDELSVYVYTAFVGNRTDSHQVMLTSCALGTRDPLWYDTVRFDVNGIDGFAHLCVYVFLVPNAKRPLDSGPINLGDGGQPKRERQKTDDGKKSALDKKLEQAKKAAQKRLEKERMQAGLSEATSKGQEEHGAAQSALSTTERQWNHLRNYLALVREQTGVELHYPVVPETHTPIGFQCFTANWLRAVLGATDEVVRIERGMSGGFGRIAVELESRCGPRTGHKFIEPNQVPTPRESDVNLYQRSLDSDTLAITPRQHRKVKWGRQPDGTMHPNPDLQPKSPSTPGKLSPPNKRSSLRTSQPHRTSAPRVKG